MLGLARHKAVHQTLTFYWRDPPPAANPPRRPIEVNVDETVWRYYYQPILDLVHSQPAALKLMLSEAALVPVDGLDIQIGILPRVLHFLEEGDWKTARHFAREGMEEPGNAGYHADGIKVVAGPTWLRPFEDEQASL